MRAGGTPGVPARRMPRPPELERSRWAAIGTAIWPASSLIGGEDREAAVVLLYEFAADGGERRAGERVEEAAVGDGGVIKGEHGHVGRAPGELGQRRAADLGEELRASDGFLGGVGDLGAGAQVVGIGYMAPSPARVSTQTVWPAAQMRRTTGASRRTRPSVEGVRSRMTATFICRRATGRRTSMSWERMECRRPDMTLRMARMK